jgi:hypothetical protein
MAAAARSEVPVERLACLGSKGHEPGRLPMSTTTAIS